MEPLKRNLIQIETMIESETTRMLTNMGTEIQSVTSKFNHEIDLAKETIESNLRAI